MEHSVISQDMLAQYFKRYLRLGYHSNEGRVAEVTDSKPAAVQPVYQTPQSQSSIN